MKKVITTHRTTRKPAIFAMAFAAFFGLAACDKHEHAEEEGEKHPEHEEKGEKPEKHEGHVDVIAGPNGGRVLTAVEPHAEFFVTDDRKVQIAFVDDDIKAVPAADQVVTVAAGDRADPTNLKFTKSGDVLVSDVVLPEGNDFPVVVSIKTDASAKAVREKFNLDLSDCPTCDFKEYACVCDHEDE